MIYNQNYINFRWFSPGFFECYLNYKMIKLFSSKKLKINFEQNLIENSRKHKLKVWKVWPRLIHYLYNIWFKCETKMSKIELYQLFRVTHYSKFSTCIEI